MIGPAAGFVVFFFESDFFEDVGSFVPDDCFDDDVVGCFDGADGCFDGACFSVAVVGCFDGADGCFDGPCFSVAVVGCFDGVCFSVAVAGCFDGAETGGWKKGCEADGSGAVARGLLAPHLTQQACPAAVAPMFSR